MHCRSESAAANPAAIAFGSDNSSSSSGTEGSVRLANSSPLDSCGDTRAICDGVCNPFLAMPLCTVQELLATLASL